MLKVIKNKFIIGILITSFILVTIIYPLATNSKYEEINGINIPIGYNQNDYIKLYNIAVENGFDWELNAADNDFDIETWRGVFWTEGQSGELRATSVDLSGYSTVAEKLDFSDMEMLSYLNINGLRISQVNIDGSQTLREFNCSDNLLTSINLSGFNNLTTLNINNNSISEINLSDCYLLETFICSNNEIESLDFSASKNLRNLNCLYNPLTSLFLEEQTNLNSLFYDKEKVAELNLADGLFFDENNSELVLKEEVEDLEIPLLTVEPYEYEISFIIDGEIADTFFTSSDNADDNHENLIDEEIINKEGYVFLEWLREQNDENKTITYTAVYGNDFYTVNFYNTDGNLIATEQVEHGFPATAPDLTEMAPDGFEFAGWDKDISSVESDLETTAIFLELYEVKFNYINVLGENTEETQLVRSGNTPNAPLIENIITPSGHIFDRWNVNFDAVESDLIITALYVKLHEVRFVYLNEFNDETQIGEIQYVKNGKSATAPPIEEIQVPFGFAFDKWDIDFSNVNANLTIKALYIKIHEVKFYGLNGIDESYIEISGSQIVKDGEGAIAPTNIITPNHYRFDEWNLEFEKVINDLHIYARYIRIHEVKFIDLNGNVIKSEIVDTGKSATPPTPPSFDGFSFVAWDKDYNEIREDNLIITALYSDEHKVTFLDWDGTEMDTQFIKTGENANPPIPSRIGYVFEGWSGGGYENIRGNVTLTAEYSKIFIVNFKDWNGNILKTQEVKEGGAAEPPNNPLRTGYDFIGWDFQFQNVQSNIDVTAVYTLIVTYNPILYSVVFKDFDGTVLKNENVIYGSSVTPPQVPKRSGYEFIGWDADFNYITSNEVIVAQYLIAIENIDEEWFDDDLDDEEWFNDDSDYEEWFDDDLNEEEFYEDELDDFDNEKFDHFIEALKSDEPFVKLTEGTGSIITKAQLEAIWDYNKIITIQLQNGLIIKIDPNKITDDAREIDLNFDIVIADNAMQINGTNISNGTIAIIPSANGNFGFEIALKIDAETMSRVGLIDKDIKFIYIADNSITKDLTNTISINTDGSLDVKISHASFYIIREEIKLSEKVTPDNGNINSNNKTQPNQIEKNPSTGVFVNSFTGFMGLMLITMMVIKKKK